MFLPAVASLSNQRGRRVAQSGVSGLQDWINRSTHADVFRAIRFDTDAAVNNFRFTQGVGHDPTPSSGYGLNVRRNATEGILGDGALELEQDPSGNMNAYWWFPFDSSKSTWVFDDSGYNRGPGQRICVQWRGKTNFGDNATSTGGAGCKFASISLLTASYTSQELVLQNLSKRGIVQMYQGQGPTAAYEPFFTAEAGGDFDLQPGSDYPVSGFCSYQAGDYANQAACWRWHNDEWVTYHLDVTPSSDGVSNGSLKLQVWKSGMSGYTTILNLTNIPMFYDSGKVFYNAFLAWIYETDRTAGPSNQKQWYDQVILSTSPIAVPLV